MSRDRVYRTKAIVLRRTDFGEADRLLTLYTPHLGKIRTVAKGVRKPTSRKSGHVELFTHSLLLIAKGRNLDIVTQAETIEPFRALRDDLQQTSYAYYLAELVDCFTEEGVENRPLFNLLLASLGWISDTADLKLTARYFELHLLDHVGYRPQLFQCVRCHEPIEPVANFFSREDGGVVCPRDGETDRSVQAISLAVLKVLRYFQITEYERCRRLVLRPETHQELERLMHGYITYLLERNLKSVAFLKRLRHEKTVLLTTH